MRDLERAAAAVTLGRQRGRQPLPAALSARIAQQAADHFAPSSRGQAVADLSEARARLGGAPTALAPTRATRFGAYGWLAAAACLVLAIFGWERSPPRLHRLPW